MGTVSQPPTIATTSMTPPSADDQTPPRIRESYQKSGARDATFGGDSSVPLVAQRHRGLDEAPGTAEPDLDRDPDQTGAAGIGGGSARTIEVRQHESMDALDDRLGAAAGVAPQNALAGAQQIGDALARRVH